MNLEVTEQSSARPFKKRESFTQTHQILDLIENINAKEPENEQEEDKFLTKFIKTYNDDFRNLKPSVFFEKAEDFSFRATFHDFNVQKGKSKPHIKRYALLMYRSVCLFSLKIVSLKLFDILIDGLIIYYCLSYTMQKADSASLHNLDTLCLTIFIIEFGLRYLAHGFFTAKTGLLYNGFHIYDLVIVTLAALYTFFLRDSSHYNLLIFRFVRILIIIPFKHLTVLFSGLFACILELTTIYFFFLIFCCIFAFIGMILFSQNLQYFCLDYVSGLVSSNSCGEFLECSMGSICVRTQTNPENNVTHFNDFLHAFLQVIRVMTFDNWSSLFKLVRASWNIGAYLYFVPLTIFGNFLVINMFLAVLKSKFDEFQHKNIKEPEKTELILNEKNSNALFLARNSSIFRKNSPIASFLRGSGLIQKMPTGLRTHSKISKNSAFGGFISNMAQEKENNVEEDISRVYRRYLMKALHFEKYSKHFVSLYDRLSDFASEIWDSYFVENLIKFPLTNIMIPKEKGSFYSIQDVMPRQAPKKLFTIASKLATNRKYRKIRVDIRKHIESLFKNEAISKDGVALQRKSIPVEKKKLTFFKAPKVASIKKKKKNKEKTEETKQAKPQNPMASSRVQRNSVNKGEEKNLKNFEEMKLVVNEDLIKPLKKALKENEVKSVESSYYEILSQDIKTRFVRDEFWSGSDTIIMKSNQKRTLKLLRTIYQSPVLLVNFLAFRDKIFYNFRVLVNNPIYRFFYGLVNILNIAVIAFGEYAFSDLQQARILDICFLLFLLDFFLKLLANSGIQNYMKDIYNLFDLLCLHSYSVHKILDSLNYVDNSVKSSRFLSAIQPLRALRFLNHFSFMHIIQLVTSKTMGDYLPLAIILFVFLYVFTLFGLQIFHKIDTPGNPLNFRDFFSGFGTCFSILTIDNWYTFVTVYLPKTNTASVVLFTLTLFLFGNFVVLDLFIAAMLHGFELICLRQTPVNNNPNLPAPIAPLPRVLTVRGGEKKKSSASVSTIDLYIKMSKIVTIFSLYWKINQEKLSKILQRFSSHALFNHFVYVMIWLSCAELGYESYYVHYWNYENEMTGQFFALNAIFNIFFAVEVGLKLYIHGLFKGGSRRFGRNLIMVMEIGNLTGFFTYFLFTEKNLLLQVSMVLKYFRPLRLIQQHTNLQKILDFFIQSISGVLNVIPIILLVWFIFAILGVNLYEDRFSYCDSPTSLGVSQEQCLRENRTWYLNDLNFNTIPRALLSLFVIATFDNWISILEVARNSDRANKGPSYNNNSYSTYLYFYSFILTSVLFLINMFLGIMFVKFQLAEKAGGKDQDHLNENQEKWVQIQNRMLDIEPFKNQVTQTQGVKKKITAILTSSQYTLLMAAFPLVVLLLLMTENEDLLGEEARNKKHREDVIIAVFAGVFSCEILLKIYAFSVAGYFNYKWNIMEFIIGIAYVILSIAELGFTEYLPRFNNTVKIFRLLRILPIFRLFHRFKFLRKMKHTITFKLPTILSILSLLSLFLFTYALLAVYFFHEVDVGPAKNLDNTLNFQGLGSAMTTLFICATGENWSQTLIDVINYSRKCGDTDYLCGSYIAILFFISFMILIHLIFLNLLTLVIITQFESLHKNPFNPEFIFLNNVTYFKKAWSRFSENTDRISRTQLIEFFRFLGPPLGVSRSDNFFIAASKVMKMEIRSDLEGYVNFHSLLHATMKNFFYEKLGLENAKEQILKILQDYEKNFFNSVTRKHKNKNRILALKARFTFREKEKEYIKINPFNDYLNLLLCFLSWRKFSSIRRCPSQPNRLLPIPVLRPPKLGALREKQRGGEALKLMEVKTENGKYKIGSPKFNNGEENERINSFRSEMKHKESFQKPLPPIED